MLMHVCCVDILFVTEHQLSYPINPQYLQTSTGNASEEIIKRSINKPLAP
jgi:hypothetical protein